MTRSVNLKAKKTSGTAAPAGAAKKAKKGAGSRSNIARWSLDNEKELVKFLVGKKAAAGDGGNFKKVTFREAADHLAGLPYKGPKKNEDSCKNKWTRVRLSLYNFLTSIQVLSLAQEGVLGGPEAQGCLRILVQ